MWKDVDDYCMAECASRQDEVNPVRALNVGHWVGKMGVSCPLPMFVQQEKVIFWLIINPHFAKPVRSRWLDIGIALFCLFF